MALGQVGQSPGWREQRKRDKARRRRLVSCLSIPAQFAVPARFGPQRHDHVPLTSVDAAARGSRLTAWVMGPRSWMPIRRAHRRESKSVAIVAVLVDGSTIESQNVAIYVVRAATSGGRAVVKAFHSTITLLAEPGFTSLHKRGTMSRAGARSARPMREGRAEDAPRRRLPCCRRWSRRRAMCRC